ncbi:MAG: hydroxyquinol 1,2-dioxygenase, partial [Polaromonas sp.]
MCELNIPNSVPLFSKDIAMRNVNEDNITDVFKGYMASDMAPRTREVMGALVQHLHDFARETNLTHDEWCQGIAFLEGCAAIETEDRHEF